MGNFFIRQGSAIEIRIVVSYNIAIVDYKININRSGDIDLQIETENKGCLTIKGPGALKNEN